MKFSSAQIHMLYLLVEDHPDGPKGYWYFPHRNKKTGDILVDHGFAERDPSYSPWKIGYRITQAGRDLIEVWDSR